MKRPIVMFAVLICLAGCAAVPATPEKPKDVSAAVHHGVRQSSDELGAMQQKTRAELQQPAPKVAVLEPVMPVYDPLEDHTVSFSMVDEPVNTVLYALAKAVGMNLILDPAIKQDDRRLTLNFEKVSAAKVLREILGTYDLYYETKDHVIRIRPFQEKIFQLNFLNAEVNTDFAVGGDVLGGGQNGAMTGLTGNFRLTGRSSGKSNAYDVLEENVKAMISSNGKFTLNRLAGSLFIKDSPAVLRSVARLINHFKEMADRQILIEARIIEVALSDGHRYGIDWSALRQKAAGLVQITEAGWNLGQGLVFKHQEGDFSMQSIINFLDTYGDTRVVSNPSIRSKHGKPAIISVGTSFSYKKSITTTRSTSGNTDNLSTDVEVSTVFDGLILGVIPFIEEDGRISLIINPIKSDVDRESLELQTVGTTDSGMSISLPRVLVKEISTTISLNNNEVAILGGLIDKRKVIQDNSVPGLSKVPILGYLFKNQVETEETRELVIILSVSLV
jgi:MSHA type pilus biogenesis protein MshL